VQRAGAKSLATPGDDGQDPIPTLRGTGVHLAEGIRYRPIVVVNGVIEKPVWAEKIARLNLNAFLAGIGVYHLQRRRVKGDLKLKPIEIGHVLHQDVHRACASRPYLQ
jgi:hypothetical protein